MIKESQVDSINANIDEWENHLHPAEFNWLYIALGFLIIIIIAAAYFFYKRKRDAEEEIEEDEGQ
jgi:LPXTG-motif cell wall-anchored protein